MQNGYNQEVIYDEVLRILKLHRIAIPKHSKKKALNYSSRKNLIEEAIKHAEYNGGKCLSKSCNRQKELLRFRCGNCSHEWMTSLEGIRRRKSWCWYCSNNSVPFPMRVKELEKKKFLCLNPDDYEDSSTFLNWKCLRCKKLEFISYQTVYGRLQRGGTPCSDCTMNLKKSRIEKEEKEMIEKMKKLNLLCLNPEIYRSGKTVMRWQCLSCKKKISLSYPAAYAKMSKGGEGCSYC